MKIQTITKFVLLTLIISCSFNSLSFAQNCNASSDIPPPSPPLTECPKGEKRDPECLREAWEEFKKDAEKALDTYCSATKDARDKLNHALLNCDNLYDQCINSGAIPTECKQQKTFCYAQASDAFKNDPIVIAAKAEFQSEYKAAADKYIAACPCEKIEGSNKNDMLDNEIAGNNINVFYQPNPASSFVNISVRSYGLDIPALAVVKVVDLTGKNIYSDNLISIVGEGNILEINTADWPQGIYLFQTIVGEEIHQDKIMINR